MSNSATKELPRAKLLGLLPDFKEKRTQQFSGIVLTIVAFSFFGLFAINPTLSTIAKLKKELKDAQFVDTALTQKIAALAILQQKYAALENDIPVVLTAIPKNPLVPELLGEIQAVAQSSGVKLDNFQNFQTELVGPMNSDQASHSYSFSLTATGPFEDLSNMISALAQMQRIITIEASALRKTAQGDFKLTFRGLAYYKP